MKNKYYWAIGIFTLLVLLLSAYARFVVTIGGGGGADHDVPDSVIAGEPAQITITLGTWGGGGAISGRYTDIALGYRLVGESEYLILSPVKAELARNYRDAMLRDKRNQYEAYTFTIPPYPKGTTGVIEYYLNTTLDGHVNHQEGIKKIAITDGATAALFTIDPEKLQVGAQVEIIGMVTSNEVKIDAPSHLGVMLASKWSEDRVVTVTYGGDLCGNMTPDAYNLKQGDSVRVRGVVLSEYGISLCGRPEYLITPIVDTMGEASTTGVTQ